MKEHKRKDVSYSVKNKKTCFCFVVDDNNNKNEQERQWCVNKLSHVTSLFPTCHVTA